MAEKPEPQSETDRRRDEALKKMLQTPPIPRRIVGQTVPTKPKPCV